MLLTRVCGEFSLLEALRRAGERDAEARGVDDAADTDAAEKGENRRVFHRLRAVPGLGDARP
jgi:hypothetical protein